MVGYAAWDWCGRSPAYGPRNPPYGSPDDLCQPHAAEVEHIATRVVRIEAGKGAASGGLELLAGRDAWLFASARHFLSSETIFHAPILRRRADT
jgi:hypothetical protein